MNDKRPPTKTTIQLRKYPNRRYYDITRSRHATLEEIHRLVCGGYDVQVTDSKTGEDITAKVLAQIILEHDPPKIGAFPVALLHEVIRANQPLIREFIEKYFSQAFLTFLESQRQFDRYLRDTLGLSGALPNGAGWAQVMMGPFAPPLVPRVPAAPRSGSSPPTPATEDGPQASDAELRKLVSQLQQQVEAVRQELQNRSPEPHS